MISRFGSMLALSTAAMCLVVGCGKPGADGGETQPLSAAEAAKYRQVKVDVKGAN